MDVVTSCGIGAFKPKWLQKFTNAKCFMAIYGLLGTIHASAYIYLVVTLSAMEKRFKISSKTTGIILTGNEISQILLSLVLSYYGAHRNRPHWIAWGVTFSAISCFIVALPHFIYGPGQDAFELTTQYLRSDGYMNVTSKSQIDNMLCLADKLNDKCHSEEVGDVLVTFLVFLSQFILGIGNTLYISLGQTYLDDNTNKTKSPVLLGWSMVLRTLGPVFGIILSTRCLRLYIDPSLDPVINHNDPRWLGAWWLGWIVLGILMLIFVLPIAMFPQYLPIENKRNPITNEENALINNKKLDEITKIEKPTFKDFPNALKRLLKNKILMFNNFAGIFYILGASGHVTYISKYIEVQFQKPATYNIISGPPTLVGMVIGFIVSGYVISKYKPIPKYLLGWNVLVGFIFIIGEICYMILDCPITDLHSYSDDLNSLQLIAQCNANCSCGNLKYSPVCSMETHTTYYSPCHAGCTTRLNDSKTFSNCTCAFQAGDNFNTTVSDAILHEGPCLTDCTYSFYMFIFISFIINLMGSSGRIGNVLVNYRSVDIKDKSFAQGLGLWMISLMALIPGPIMYGIIIDSTCLLWDESCGMKGNCWLYDRKKMRHYMNSMAIVLTVAGVIFDSVVWYFGRNLNLYENPVNEENDEHHFKSNQNSKSKAENFHLISTVNNKE